MKIVIRSTGSLGTASAPANASYITLAAESTLTSERRLVAGSGINIQDNGANSTVIISVSGSISGSGGGITQLTGDVTAGPGSGSQAASVITTTGAQTGPGGVPVWWLLNNAGSLGLKTPPGESGPSIWHNYGANPNSSNKLLSTDGTNLYLGGDANGAWPIQTHVKGQHGTLLVGASNRLAAAVLDSNNNGSHSGLSLYQALGFSRQEVYNGGAAFSCDGGLYASLMIEVAIAAGGGTINLPANPSFSLGASNPGGRAILIADTLGTLGPGNSLSISAAGKTINGSASPYVVTDPYWSGILIIDSAQSNWIVFSNTSLGGGGGGGGSTYFDSTISGSIYTSGSMALVGGFDEYGLVTSPSDKGSDVFFYVSGSVGSRDGAVPGVSLFGGDVVVSGSVNIESIGLEVTGSLIVTGSMSMTGSIEMMGSIVPDQDVTYTLGTSNKRWGHVYTGDLHLRNDRGDWTIVEEREYLCVVNNITGKKFKMMLQPLDE